MENTYHKLVRDYIPENIERHGEIPIYHELSKDEYWKALLEKDQEELLEVETAKTLDEMKEELADKVEVLRAMAAFHGINFEDVLFEADKKKAKKGGFEKRIFLEKVIIK